MPARTSLLAAGNPEYGRFDLAQPIADQITLGPALLSRFDLMFMLQDTVDEEKDREIANHAIESKQEAVRHTHHDGAETDLIDPDVDKDLLRAYVAYARERIHPVIEDEAVKQLQPHEGSSETVLIPVQFPQIPTASTPRGFV